MKITALPQHLLRHRLVCLMKTIKVRALVLREYEAGESDKRLLLLCKEHGRIMAYARGARKPSSKFMAASQLFTYADFVLAMGNGFYSVTQAEVIESFYSLRQDYDRLMTACSVVELCEKTVWDNINCDVLLQLALKTLSHLSKGKLPHLQVYCVFLHRFLMFHGIWPRVQSCIVCNAPATESNFLCPEGLVCDKHKPPAAISISTAAITALQFIQNSDLAQSFMFNAHENVISELKKAASNILKSHELLLQNKMNMTI